MKRTICLLLTMLLLGPLVSAREIAGVTLPDTAQLSPDGTTLVLNGAGVRRKFFFKIYAAGLYLPSRQTTSEAIVNLPGPKRVRMHFLYKEVDREKLIIGWQEGFANNLDSASLAQMSSRLTQFNQLMRTMRQGDVIDLDFLPEEETQVRFNGELQGRIEGADFYAALLQVWLGKNPVDSDLKSALLKDTDGS
ncbi:MAG: chalcone isomerase family protein [Thiohalomonadales bacterium]|nr:chalcone isomerase family protein [Thiohalomonadales bacterium]